MAEKICNLNKIGGGIKHETKTATSSANGAFYLTVPLDKILFVYCISPNYYMLVRNGVNDQAVGFVFDENFSKGANQNVTYGIVYRA